jgi:hypothetical protein
MFKCDTIFVYLFKETKGSSDSRQSKNQLFWQVQWLTFFPGRTSKHKLTEAHMNALIRN